MFEVWEFTSEGQCLPRIWTRDFSDLLLFDRQRLTAMEMNSYHVEPVTTSVHSHSLSLHPTQSAPRPYDMWPKLWTTSVHSHSLSIHPTQSAPRPYDKRDSDYRNCRNSLCSPSPRWIMNSSYGRIAACGYTFACFFFPRASLFVSGLAIFVFFLLMYEVLVILVVATSASDCILGRRSGSLIRVLTGQGKLHLILLRKWHVS